MDMIDIVADEIACWKRMEADSCDEDKYKYHGAVCELMSLAGKPENLTVEALREEYKIVKRRADEPELKNRELDIMARNRAVKACEAVVRLGRRISALDKSDKTK